MDKIADAFSLIRNGANIKQGLDDSGYPITRIETISNRTVDRDKMGYAGITDITKYSDYVLQDGDILMSHINSETHLGKVARYEKYEGETIIHGMNLLCLRPNKNLVDSRYAFYYLSSEAFLHQIPRITKKSVNQASFNVAALKELTFPISSMEVQQPVADILDKANELIALRKEQLAKLDELVKARFVEMFEKGEFERIPFEAFCEFLRNGASIKQTKGAGGYPITRIETLANDAFNLDRLGYANITELKGFEKYILQKGDILISHINSVAYLGRAVQYRGESNTPIIHGMNLLCARLRHDCNSTYVEYFFKTPMAKDYISTITKKAVNQASITTTDLKKMLIPAPPLELQNCFAAFVAEVDKSKVAVQKALDEAQLLFDSLMQKYFG